jgi:hypothetical protein
MSKDVDGNTIYGVHFRMKGVTGAGAEHRAKTYSPDGRIPEYVKMFEHLATGAKIPYILNPINVDTNADNIMMEFTTTTVSTRKEFVREVQFPSKASNINATW